MREYQTPTERNGKQVSLCVKSYTKAFAHLIVVPASTILKRRLLLLLLLLLPLVRSVLLSTRRRLLPPARTHTVRWRRERRSEA